MKIARDEWALRAPAQGKKALTLPVQDRIIHWVYVLVDGFVPRERLESRSRFFTSESTWRLIFP
jgi:hypothetical protein